WRDIWEASASPCAISALSAWIRKTILFICAAQCRGRKAPISLWRSQGGNMATVDIKNLKNEVVGKLDLSDDVFAGEVNEGLLNDAVKQYLASQRAGTHKTKTRGEVSGSGKKPW